MSVSTSNQWEVLKDILESRGSVKRYDTTYELPTGELEQILEAASLAPSSWNLQHWRFMVFQGKEEQAELAKLAYNQPQVSESSAVVAILGDLRADLVAEQIFSPVKEAGFLTEEAYQNLINNISVTYQDGRRARDEAFLNASLAAMQLMLTAKAKGLDTCPMGGFDRAAFVEKYQLDKRYAPVMLISIGKPAQSARPSSRMKLDQLILPKGKN